MIKGIILLLGSALSFALSTVFVKLITSSTEIPAIELTFFRFSFGFIAISLFVSLRVKSLKPVRFKYIALRSILNTIAVIFFFMGVGYSTVSKVNLLNMTYPVFVFLLSPFINREKAPPLYVIYLLLTMVGIYFVVMPAASTGLVSINLGDLFGLISGIIAGFAITILREARKYDDSYLIIFYLMLFGTITTFLLTLPYFVIPRGIYIVYSLLLAISALVGQVCLTVGYKYISATAGSLVSASRIIFAIILGAVLFADPITLRILLGALLIMISLAGVSGAWKLIKKPLYGDTEA